MSVIGGVNNNFYAKNEETGFYSVNQDKIVNREQAQVVIDQVVSDARIERLKAVANVVIAGSVALLLGAGAFIVVKVATLFFAIIFFPLAIIPPLYGLVTTLCGLGVGGAVGFLTIKKYAKQFLDGAKLHWDYSNHLYQEKHKVVGFW